MRSFNASVQTMPNNHNHNLYAPSRCNCFLMKHSLAEHIISKQFSMYSAHNFSTYLTHWLPPYWGCHSMKHPIWCYLKWKIPRCMVSERLIIQSSSWTVTIAFWTCFFNCISACFISWQAKCQKSHVYRSTEPDQLLHDNSFVSLCLGWN